MKKMKLSRNIATLLAIATLVCSLGTTTAFAAEPEATETATAATTNVVEPRAGTETLPLGWYTISSRFSIKGHNTTPVKTVQGRYLKLDYSITKPVTDNPIAVMIEVKDYNTKETIGKTDIFFMDSKAYTASWRTLEAYDLGYAGRKVQIYTRIDSSGTEVNKTVTFTNFKSYVYN